MKPSKRVYLTILAALVVGLPGACKTGSGPTGPPPGEALVYAAIGASDAVGVGAFPFDKGYVFLVHEKLKEARPGSTLSNLGISGAKIDEFVQSELPGAIAANPDLVTVWAGPNDIIGGRTPEWFESNLRTLLGELRSRTHAVVYVADIADFSQAPYFQIFPDSDVTRARIDEFNRRVRAVGADTGCILVKLSERPLDSSMYSIDGFHPSNKGHAMMADAFWEEIEPRL